MRKVVRATVVVVGVGGYLTVYSCMLMLRRYVFPHCLYHNSFTDMLTISCRIVLNLEAWRFLTGTANGAINL